MLQICGYLRFIRFYSDVGHVTKKVIKYTNTINLPKTDFPVRLKAAERIQIETKFADIITTACYQHQAEYNELPEFILHDGPPYANGDLHMGHAVNKILKDITIRHHVIRGQKINFVPGWDCHGLPIELKAIGADDTRSDNMYPLYIRQKSRQFALDAIESQKEEFHSWGILCDWSNKNNYYCTFDANFLVNELNLFLNLYEKGLIYRDLKPVFWSPSSRTALAEAELEYDNNFVSPSVYIRFKVGKLPSSISERLSNAKNVYVIIWTTTPWTLPSNQAVCFNSNLEYALVKLRPDDQQLFKDDDYYILAKCLLKDFEENTKIPCEILETFSGCELSNCTYQHPIYNEDGAMPFFDSSHVVESKGTGLVHTAPAHGFDDFLVCLAKNIPIKSLVNEEGVFNNQAPAFLQNKHALVEGNDLVIKHLKENCIFNSTLTHSYPIDWRTKKPIIIRASQQWFINTSALKDHAINEIEKIDIFPKLNAESSRKTLAKQILKRPYWCISRQRTWGLPIPVFYEKVSGKTITNRKIIQHINELIIRNDGIDFWWLKSVEELLPLSLLDELNLKHSDVVKGADIFDIWFDSGSTWTRVLKEQEMADLYLEGYDQFTGWFQSSLLTSTAYRKCSPYKALFVHGFTVDANGNKMSKSLGNVISPKQITCKYGVDVLRWWVAAHATQHMAITVSEALLNQTAEDLQKVRTKLRFVNGILRKYHPDDVKDCSNNKSYLDRYMLNKLLNFENEIISLYKSYEYNRVVAAIQNFTTNTLSGFYINLTKDRLYCGSNDDINNVRNIFHKCYLVLCKALWPLAPYLVEESWSYYDDSSRFYEQLFKTDPLWKDEKVNTIIDTALDIKRLLNQQLVATNSWTVSLEIKCAEQASRNLLKHIHPILDEFVADSEFCEILQVNSIKLCNTTAAFSSTDHEIRIVHQTGNLCPRCRRFAITDKEDICQRCSNIVILHNLQS